MTGYLRGLLLTACLTACASEPTERAAPQPIMQQQGTALSGIVLQGAQFQGLTLQGFRFATAKLNGSPLDNLRLVGGELIAEQNGITLHGTSLVEMRVLAEARNDSVQPPQTVPVAYKITGIVPEDPKYDPTQTGATFLYSLSQNVDGAGNWQPACPVDSDGRRAAVPLAEVWDSAGNPSLSASVFTFGCTTGVIAKCYRWGYRPWVAGYGNLMATHQTCTRLARADYCGDGISHTMNGTLINVWDVIGAPGPIQPQGTTPPGMTFEAAWNPSGAICLSHARWGLDGSAVSAACRSRLRPPGGPGMPPGTVCDNVIEAAMQPGSGPRLFNQSTIQAP